MSISPLSQLPASAIPATIRAVANNGGSAFADRLQRGAGLEVGQPSLSSAAQGAIVGGMKDSAAVNKLTNLMLSGQQFSPSQLIAVQAVLYRATMGVTAVTKLAEQASGAVKTVMQQNI